MCYFAKSCVRGLEHHSTFLNNCCGAHNRLWFVISLTAVALVTMVSSALAAYDIIGMRCFKLSGKVSVHNSGVVVDVIILIDYEPLLSNPCLRSSAVRVFI